ncbi:LuxR family transcriptional activator of bioluminescence operon [Natronocella acetinitrilica]|uniref:LuxR family transcriptional activator of bioluminescence operon n=1 Tax=Natronocella acetinitrilica TaxID=414046 RepID=A0AAE3KB03_9GAMM|nr:LuxR family transcriptional regulator [Natronocella acetinitrilica]MCP1673023.1 LuxR family transcriptional activator of bioluminescence operon [Natronocella acetinitrilica]
MASVSGRTGRAAGARSDATLADLAAFSAGVGDVAGVRELCERVTRALGLDYFLYGLHVPSSMTDPDMLVIDGFPAGYVESVYRPRNYVQIDPVVHHLFRCVTPVLWRDLHDLPLGDGRQFADLLHEAESYGLVTGAALPMHGPRGTISLYSIASRQRGPKAERMLRQCLPDALLALTHIHEAAMRVTRQDELEHEALTPRELECLAWCAEGKTSWETARILGIAERTVVFHLQNVNMKLRVSSRQQAVAQSIAMGLVNPTPRRLPKSDVGDA